MSMLSSFLAMVVTALPGTREAPPNVVLIISDDQHWGDYSFLGHPHVRTPRIDQLASESVCFTRGYVPCSLCCPSLASMVTGLQPHVHRITGNEPPGKRGTPEYRAACEEMDSFIDDLPTLPKLLATEGYLSLQTGKWWLGSGQRGGFTHAMTHGDPARGGRHGDEGLKIGRQGLGVVEDFIDEAHSADQPFFVWYAPFLPHTPHNPPERLLQRYRDRTESLPIAKYWAMCEWFDETCGQLLDLLTEKKVADNTIVLYVTDNGWINLAMRSRYAPRSKRSPYDGGLRTPIMVRWPGHLDPRRDDATVVSSLDLAPTILHAAGVEVPAAMTGLNLCDTTALRARPRIFGAVFEHDALDLHDPVANLRYRWCIEGARKIILPHAARVPDAAVELFDLVTDPHEERDLAATSVEQVKQLTHRVQEWWKLD